MSDPLDDLRAQRELVARQLAALDQKIGATGAQPAPASPPPPAETAPAGGEDPLAEYRQEPAQLKHTVTRGCLLYFSAALLLLVLLIAAWWYWHYRPANLPPGPPPAAKH